MERTTDYTRCPVHYNLLKPKYYNGFNVWYCKRCAVYYSKGKNGSMTSHVTIQGTPILFNENLVLISKEALLAEQKKAEEQRKEKERKEAERREQEEQQKKAEEQRKKREEVRQFNEHYRRLPAAPEWLICPIHHERLLSKKATLDFAGTIVHTFVGYCQPCDTMYINDLQTALLGDTVFLGKRVTWIPFRFKNGISNLKLRMKTKNIAMVQTKAALEKPNTFIITATAVITLQDRGAVEVDGYYIASEQQFYTTPQILFSRILLKECDQLQISDPQKLIQHYTHCRQFRSQQESIKKQVDRTLKKTVYTLPLLKGDDKHCPFCYQEIHRCGLINIAIYHEKVAIKTRRISCLFCRHCKIPFISLPQEMAILNVISPQMIYVFDARACANPQELLQRATHKYKRRPDQVTKTAPLPLEKELEEGKPLPNLSYGPENSKVYVYKDKCHCSACQKKYGQNTIRNRAALVKTTTGETVKVNVEFCVGCGRYFMNITSLNQYRKRYGSLLMECMMDTDAFYTNSAWLGFAPDTILSRCGYSVKEGIPRTHREAVLAYVLDSGKATKYEVLEIISRFINLRSAYLPAACERWQEDLLFVNEYKIHTQQVVEGLKFQPARK